MELLYGCILMDMYKGRVIVALDYFNANDTCRLVTRGAWLYMVHLSLKFAGKSTFYHKMGKNGGLQKIRERVRFKKLNLWVQKFHCLRSRMSLKINPGCGPGLYCNPTYR